MHLKTQHLRYIALLVRDYDEAKAYYCGVLGFDVLADTPVSAEKRWVLIAPPGSRETRLLLAKAANPDQIARVGDQTGGRVFLFLHTDDFWRDFRDLRTKGVKFCREPQEEIYGIVAMFEDLYGNRWDLLQLNPGQP
jgi:lactoylglutathione lyase